MVVSNKDIKDLLKQELENKKFFKANRVTDCGMCGADIFEGDKFCFMRDKKKVCQTCFEQV